jgi:hypothetical protein
MAFSFPKPTDKIVINNSLPPTQLNYNSYNPVMANISIQPKLPTLTIAPSYNPVMANISIQPKLPTLTTAPSLAQCKTTCSKVFSPHNEYLKCGSASLAMSAITQDPDMIKCIGSHRQQLYDCNKICTTIVKYVDFK